ncbi:MAG: hypothetical protein A6F71_09855 [Cycloclasticus sp. symbiont of Poecilosclerida sp. M]|nr:MAG: hypothetical protein A6F71_09855 [Cycloclasticus sp. symbiont of Poecilosclerida sp. M]
MHSDLSWNGVVAEDPQAFSDAAVALYQDKVQWQKCQRQGVEILKTCYNPSDYLQLLLARIEHVRKELTAHREQDFQGGLLRHHLLKSTKYMSLWIEEKNKGQAS